MRHHPAPAQLHKSTTRQRIPALPLIVWHRDGGDLLRRHEVLVGKQR
jgi:hypothetical protein